MKGIPSILSWAFIGFGISYVFWGFWNDLNVGAPWQCPGPYYTATTFIECFTETTWLVEVPIGLAFLAIGIVLYLVDKMYVQKK